MVRSLIVFPTSQQLLSTSGTRKKPYSSSPFQPSDDFAVNLARSASASEHTSLCALEWKATSTLALFWAAISGLLNRLPFPSSLELSPAAPSSSSPIKTDRQLLLLSSRRTTLRRSNGIRGMFRHRTRLRTGRHGLNIFLVSRHRDLVDQEGETGGNEGRSRTLEVAWEMGY